MDNYNTASITNDYMMEMLAKTKNYCIVILKVNPNKNLADAKQIIWEHGRRNFALREDGVMPIVCPVTDNSDVAGIGIFDAEADKVKEIMDEDPGVKAEVFVYEIHTCRGFPGSTLP